jgi:hypothetical protein
LRREKIVGIEILARRLHREKRTATTVNIVVVVFDTFIIIIIIDDDDDGGGGGGVGAGDRSGASLSAADASRSKRRRGPNYRLRDFCRCRTFV